MKKLVILAAASILLFALFPGKAKGVVSFDDVPMDHPFVWEIIYLYGEGIIDGYPDGNFRPSNNVTRAQAMKMIGKAVYLYDEQRPTPFSDVPANHFASGFITSAYEYEWIRGYPDGTFRPNAHLTRGQAAIVLANAFKWGEAQPARFSDVDANTPMAIAIAKLAEQGVAKGYPDGTFKPYQRITRGQFSAMLARAAEPTFVPDYLALLETANDILVHLQNEEFDNIVPYLNDEHGLRFCPYAGSCIDHGGVMFSAEDIPGFMTDTNVYYWGDQDGSGFPIELTTASYYQDWLMDAPYTEKERYGRSIQPATHDLIRVEYPNAKVVEFYFAGTDQYEGMDWQSLNMIFEKDENGEWKLIAIINDRWTI
ncbi:S-layer homology domain-containing protein [Jeotgalibacillus sp. R-1-5s-1]|uniref:S-layer homology domain-containing protein n=1 Tax=Jeotgalibacillus sp. R-1-5s-1 TaxID=2555897 RepID=UPI00106D5D27|nr:S-layer homology domain-containing protein [Jeotgalibacillus sp. R-1-5s-1]TFD96274.1 S-layer homology domain-containing protein [Jeotgalibacillus sp. R-1-5s-1]